MPFGYIYHREEYQLPMCQNGNTLLPNPTSVGHNTELICVRLPYDIWRRDWLWLTFYSVYSVTTTPAMMQEDAAS